MLAYELLAGRPPFVRETRDDVLAAHLRDVPPPLTTYRSDVPAPLAELVMTCFAKRADDRWPDADAILRRLDRVSLAKPDTTPPVWPGARWTSAAARAAGSVVAFGLGAWQRARQPHASWRSRWDNRHVEPLTDFPGSAVDAAISADGRFVAFLADRDGVFDAFVTEVRSGQFHDLTGGRYPELYNEDVRNIGFFADGENVWIRVADIATPASVFRVPTLGGPLRPFLPRAVTVVWPPDGSKLAYHEMAPGDPIHVADGSGANPHRIHVARPGLHNHYPSWSPDGRVLYVSHGSPPNEMDVWRIPADGGTPERVTSHNSRVAYPVLFDERTLLYTATADDGTGPWLYWMDLKDRLPQRATKTVEHYISIAVSAEVPGRPRRLVATVSNPSIQLWTVPITTGVATERDASRVSVPTARSAAPRFGPDGSLLYLASRGGAYGLWRRISEHDASELWKPEEGAMDGAAAVSPDGKKICFPVRRHGRSTLYRASTDGTGARPFAESLDVRSAASWSPDGKWIAVAAKDDTGIRVFTVPAEGGPQCDS